MHPAAKFKSLANLLKSRDAKPYGSKGAFGRLRQPVAIWSRTLNFIKVPCFVLWMTISMGIYLFVTNLCSDTVRSDREEGETRGYRSEIAVKTVTSVKWRLSEIKKRLLASLLSLAMVATMMPAALADDEGNKTADRESGNKPNFAINSADALQTAIAGASGDSYTISLDTDITSAVSIPKDKSIVLNLNGCKLTNTEGKDTITVAKNATLTITGTGTVDNISHGKAAIYNMGTAILKNGVFERSQEAGKNANDNGGNSYYTLLNHGVMTVQADVTVNNKGGHSSLFDNGYFSWKSKDGIDNPTLTIKGGKFDGGLNTIKNDDDAILNIAGGEFINYTQAAFQNHGSATVTGGKFEASSVYSIYNCGCDPEHDLGKLDISDGTFNGQLAVVGGNSDVNITGGTFNGKIYKNAADKLSISGGTFSTDVSKYCVDGKTALEQNNGTFVVKELKKNEDVVVAKADKKGDTQATVNNSITDKDAATATGETVAPTEAIKDDNPIDVTTEENAITALKNASMITLKSDGTIVDKTVTIVKETYLDVKVEEYTLGTTEDTYKISMDITPKCNLIATTDKNNQTEENSVTFSKGNLMKVTAKTKVTVTLPSVFANKLVYINHDNKELYTATADKDGKITFETNGFSPFTFTLTKPSGFDNGSSGGSSGGGSSSSSTYKVTVATVSNGSAKASASTAAKDATVTVTLSPDKGYKLDKITVTDASGKEIATTKKSDTSYTFTMPASAVTVKVAYVKDDAAVVEPTTGFNDVADKDWFADAVKYVADKGMMNGTSKTTFGPNDSTTRGMIVTVLYRLENEPSAAAASFTDVVSGQYYTDAVAWANANGIVTGYGNGKFGPNDVVTREQFAAILYRYAQYKKYDVSVGEDTNILSYADAQSVSAYAIPAMQWAGGAGIVNGSNGKLNPQNNATRAEVATMLMRYCEKVAK